jgi:hypothetical protein
VTPRAMPLAVGIGLKTARSALPSTGARAYPLESVSPGEAGDEGGIA